MVEGDITTLGLQDSEGLLLDIVNDARIKVLYPGGLSYSDGDFFRVTMPSELGVDIEKTKLGGAIISLPELLDQDLKEKYELDILNQKEFHSSSIFYHLDQLKSVSQQNPTREDLGAFYDHIPNVDFILCSDMGTEPADFILSSPSKLVFVHVKCGARQNPQSSAGAIAEVGGQAIKNLEMLVSHNQELFPANRGRLLGKWPSNTPDALQERIRLMDKIRFINPQDSQDEREAKLEDALTLITVRRQSAAIKKEIWIVVGNAFSRNHFVDQMGRGNQAAGTSLQAYQLIDSWMATCASADVDLKFFVSP